LMGAGEADYASRGWGDPRERLSSY
jgi:hypothetical protein